MTNVSVVLGPRLEWLEGAWVERATGKLWASTISVIERDVAIMFESRKGGRSELCICSGWDEGRKKSNFPLISDHLVILYGNVFPPLA